MVGMHHSNNQAKKQPTKQPTNQPQWPTNQPTADIPPHAGDTSLVIHISGNDNTRCRTTLGWLVVSFGCLFFCLFVCLFFCLIDCWLVGCLFVSTNKTTNQRQWQHAGGTSQAACPRRTITSNAKRNVSCYKCFVR